MSCDLIRRDIRAFFTEALRTAGGFQLASSGSERPPAEALPWVRVSTPESEESFLGGSPPCYRSLIRLVISLAVSGTEDAADELAHRLHRKLMAAAPGCGAETVRRTGCRTESREGGRLMAAAELHYEISVSYREDRDEAEIRA